MKSMKVAVLSLVGTLLTVQQAFAGTADCISHPDFCTNGGDAVPEMDGSGAIIAIGLVIGLVALLREKFFHK